MATLGEVTEGHVLVDGQETQTSQATSDCLPLEDSRMPETGAGPENVHKEPKPRELRTPGLATAEPGMESSSHEVRKTSHETTEIQTKFSEGHTPETEDETRTPQTIRGHSLCNGTLVPDMAVGSSKVNEEPNASEFHIPDMMAATPSQSALEPGTNETQNVTTTDNDLRPGSEASSKNTMSLVAAVATKDKTQLDEQAIPGKRSSGDLDRKRVAVFKAYEDLINEEAAIEKRIGLPSEKPSDKTHLQIIKQELGLCDTALDNDELLGDMDIAEDDKKLVHNTIGVPISAFRAPAKLCKKPTPTTKKNTDPAAKKRKYPSGNPGGPSKKRKPAQGSKMKVPDYDAVSKHMLDQIAGRGTAATDNSDPKKQIPPLRHLGNPRLAEYRRFDAAARRTHPGDDDSWGMVDADIRWLFALTKVIPKECKLTLTPLPGKESIDEEKRDIDDYGWSMKGMASKLRHHQLMAAEIMCKIERAGEYSGGLLFDYMGYGKTVESLALVVANKMGKPIRGECVKTTLVVVPTAAVQQWVQEVKLHYPGPNVSRWMEDSEMDAQCKCEVLVISYDKVRTVYQKAVGSTGRGSRKAQQDNTKDGSRPVINHPLFNTKFYRIILDEMHEIKGYKITYKAVMALKGKYRWGLTGTPTPNGLEELYPYLTFIHHPGITTRKDFQKTYVGGQGRHAIKAEERYKRLNELLAPIMIMRTAAHSFLGSTLLKLPQHHLLPPIKVRFLAEEKIIYQFLEKRMQGHVLEKAAKMESVRQEAANDEPANKKTTIHKSLLDSALTILRRCVSSPLLLQKLAMDKFWTTDDIGWMRREALNAGCQSTPFIDQIERWVLNGKKGHARRAHGSRRRAKTIANAREVLDAETCPGTGCRKTIAELDEPVVSDCGHVWCKTCLENHIQFEKVIVKRPIFECSRCHKPLGEAKPCSPAAAGDEVTHPQNQAATLKKRPGEDYNGNLPRGGKTSNLVSSLCQDPSVEVPRSAKVDAVVRLIIKWLNEAPEDKIIVFIQWVDLNPILGRLLQDEGIDFLYYAATTEMKEAERSAAIETFKNDPDVKVLICSLRCGGQALNLTCANRTIMFDLWWNQEVEAQAMARVYRMGQQKETYFVRVTVEDSVDGQIYDLQLKKTREIQNAFQEFEADRNLDKQTLYKLLGWKTADDESLGHTDTDSDEADSPRTDSDVDSDDDYRPNKKSR